MHENTETVAPVQTAPETPSQEAAQVDSLIDGFLGDPGVPVETPAAPAAPASTASDAAPQVGQPENDAQPVETQNAPAATPDVVQRLLDQNAELMRMLAERSKAPEAPAPKAPTEGEQKAAVIKQLQDEMGLSAEDAAKHYAIIEKVADMKAAPALEAARAAQQAREQSIQKENETVAHTEAVRIIGENETILGSASTPFASLTKEQQSARQEFIQTFDDLRMASIARGVQPDVKALMQRAFRAVAGDDTAMSRARQELSRTHDAAKARRTVPTTASRNGTTTPQMVRRGGMTLSAVEASSVDKQIDDFLAANG